MTPYISKAISVSRFPIICGIVFIHTQIFEATYLSLFCGEIFGRIGVPLFYFVSGYLFFQNYNNSLTEYKNKLYKRLYSLFIPYLLWNFIAFVVYALITNEMYLSQIFESFWIVDNKEGASPANGPLWFIRNLMIYSILSPFIYILNIKKYLSWLSPILLLCWLLNFSGINKGIITGFIFFNIGSWFAIYNIDKFIKEPSKTLALIIFFLWIICSFIELLWLHDIKYHKLVILLGFAMFYSLPVICKNNKFERLVGYSFFLYCFHEIVINVYQKFCTELINKEGYLFFTIIVILTSILGGYILKHITPTIFKLLSGDR